MMARNLLAALLAVGYSANASAADVPKNAKRPKVKVTFDRTDFQVSYGKTLDLCMKVVPSGRFTPKIQFASSPAGVIEGKFGGSANCAASFTPIQIKVSLSQCIAEASLLIKVNNKTVATLPGTIMLPDKIYSTFWSAGICDSNVAYFVHFESNAGAANFNGLSVSESWVLVPPDSCQMGGREDSWTIGTLSTGDPAPQNVIDDGNGRCPLPSSNCTSLVHQTFHIGACSFPATPIDITVKSVNGVDSVTRSDCTGDHCVGGQ